MSRVISYREVYENNNKQILLSEEQYNVLKMDNVQLSVLVNEKDKEIERLNKENEKLEKENNLLKQIVGNNKQYTTGIR